MKYLLYPTRPEFGLSMIKIAAVTHTHHNMKLLCVPTHISTHTHAHGERVYRIFVKCHFISCGFYFLYSTVSKINGRVEKNQHCNISQSNDEKNRSIYEDWSEYLNVISKLNHVNQFVARMNIQKQFWLRLWNRVQTTHENHSHMHCIYGDAVMCTVSSLRWWKPNIRKPKFYTIF